MKARPQRRDKLARGWSLGVAISRQGEGRKNTTSLFPVCQSLAASSHCTDPTRSQQASLTDLGAWHGMVAVGERQMTHGI